MKTTRTLCLLPILSVAVIAAIWVPVTTIAVAESPHKDWLPLPEGEILRIAFGSCAKQWQHQPIWKTVVNTKPDLFLFLGDAIYADTDGITAWSVSEGQLKGDWNRLADKPEFQVAKANIPFMATWDNHDYGTHDGGVEFPLKEASQSIFLDFFGEPVDSERRKTPGICDAKIFGPEGRRVQIILLDTRFFKDRYKKDPTPKSERLKAGKVGGYLPDDDPGKTLLGPVQWVWLEDQLKKPAEVRLIASSIQIIPDEKGMDEWGNFPLERKKLFELIGSTGAKGIVLLSGNVHFAELSKSYAGDYPFFELTSSGMTHINEAYAKATNEYRIAGPSIRNNFGLMEIEWEAKPSPLITLKVIGADGSTAFEHQITLASLSSMQTSESSKGVETLTPCQEPRPQVCTREYRPVCAKLQDGGFKTYANGCTACTDPAVAGYRDGACE